MRQPAFLGIDPGKSGAACLLSRKEPLFYDWPKSNDLAEVFSVIQEWWSEYDIKMTTLERVSSMPKQGVKSMFSFGQNLGQWQMLITCLQLPFTHPTPQEWQKGVGIKKSDGPDPKSRVRVVCGRLFPEVALKGPRGGWKDGRADAILIAHFARRYYRGLV